MKAKCLICTDENGQPVEVEVESKQDRDRWVRDHADGHGFFTDDPVEGHGAVVKAADG